MAALELLGQWGGGYYGPGGMMGGGGMGWGWFGMLFPLLIFILVVVGLVMLIRWMANMSREGGGRTAGPDSAMEVLRRRYAQGEIGKEEFEEKKRDLS